mgnify:CR=1 FL=1
MRYQEIISEEGYDTQRDKDAVSGKPRKTSIGKGKKPEGYSKDKAEKAAMDNVKKVLAKETTTAGSIATSTDTGAGNGFLNGGPGSIIRRTKGPKKKKKR